jgi:hypothetical protein
MSSHVVGFRPPDADWLKMKLAYDSCEAAGVPVPDVVDKFFNCEPPDELGVQVNLDSAATHWSADMQEGMEIELAKVPKSVTHIRFYNSY